VASLGGGTCTCVVPGEALEDALRGIGREIGAPLVVDVKVEGADDPAPARVPDLFAGRAATVFFRLKKGKGVTVTGRWADGKAFKEVVKPRSVELPAIDHLWARARVADLEDRFRLQGGDQDQVRKEIIALAIAHTLLTRFTSFVVVDESEIVNKGGDRHQVVQPVPMPAQWEMECDDASTVGAARGAGGAPAGIMSQACMAPPPPPASPAPAKCMSAPSEKAKKPSRLGGLFGKKEGDERTEVREESKVSSSERKAFDKAVGALKDALAAARSQLSAGRIPPVGPVERARKALLSALGASALGTQLAALQRLLRTGLLELSAALAASAPAEASSVASLLDRCRAELDEALRQGPAESKFWEKTV
jgi:Ca-activated chloride channel family protein